MQTTPFKSVTADLGIIDNTVQEVVEHPVPVYYSLTPNNRNVSSVYKLNQTKVTKKNSLLIYDNETGELVTELPTNPNLADRYFIFHTPIFKSAPYNSRIELTDNYGGYLKFNPSHILGKFIGTCLRLLPPESYSNGKIAIEIDDIIPTIVKETFLSDTFVATLQKTIDYFDHESDLQWILDVMFRKTNTGRVELNYDLLLNTNIGFVTGILDGITDLHQFRDDGILKVQYNVDRATIIDILTYLDASYIDVRTDDSTGHEYIIKLPAELQVRRFSNLPIRAFVMDRYIFDDQGVLSTYNDISDSRGTSFMTKLSDTKKFTPIDDTADLFEMVNHGFMFAYPLSWFDIREHREAEVLYDFTMSDANAQNFALLGGPVLLNSDGDLLNSSILQTVEAVEAASVLSPSTRNYWKRLDDPTKPISSVSDNAIIGLHTGTTIPNK